MRIGIDVDETLVNTEESFEKIIDKYKLDVKCKYNKIWTKKEFSILYPYFTEMLGSVSLKECVKEVLDELSKQGHELYVITARSNKYGPNIKQVTLDLLDNNELKFDGIYFGQDKKSDLAKKLNIDLMIDDNISVYNNMKKEGIDCILFGDKINNWKDVLKYIEGRK